MIRLSAFADEAGESLREQIAATLENGLSETDVRNIDGKNVLNFSEAETREFARAFRAEGIRVACIGSPLGKREVCGFREFRGELEKILRTAEMFGTDRVRIFSFYHAANRGEEVKKCIAQAVACAAKVGIRLYHENELGIYGENAAKCLELISETDCGCVYDPANFVLAGQEIGDAEKALLPYSDFFHVKDARRTGEIVPAGYGDARIRELLTREDVLLTVEPHLAEFGGYAGLTERDMVRSEFCYDSPRAAFDAGVSAVKRILAENGFERGDNGEWRRAR